MGLNLDADHPGNIEPSILEGRMQLKAPLWQALLALIMGTWSALAAPSCPIDYGAHADAKSNKLYLYFASADDPSFPEFGRDVGVPPNPKPTSPLHPFDISDLPDYKGTVGQLRDAIYDVVTDIYCDFNVQVIQTDKPPSAGGSPHSKTVGIGTDDKLEVSTPPCQLTWWAGLSERHLNIPNPQFARIWAGTFETCAGAPAMGKLHGPNSTLDRWANSIGGTAAHEAAHNYGLSHADGCVPTQTGEDPWKHHLMRAGNPKPTDGCPMPPPPQGYSFEDQARRRHFSDHEYSLLASNVGLAMDTMWNWDFTNPNSDAAAKLRMSFLSTRPQLVISQVLSGPTSPWVSPTLSGPSGTRMFKGSTYNVYQLEWSSGQVWSGGPNGQVPASAHFQVGVTFSSVNPTDPDAVIITDVTLSDQSGNPLPQHPRWMGFDAGTFDLATGGLNVRFFNFLDRPLIVRDVQVRELPRVISINAMARNERITDLAGRVLRPWSNGTRRPLRQQTVEKDGEIRIEVARLRQKRRIFHQVTEKECAHPEAACTPGAFEVDLFPATTMYITATVVDQRGQRWDPKQNRFVNGPVESRLFYQIAGRHPDLNHNGVDDLIDIRSGKSRDRRRTGIPDDAPHSTR
jgi:hypothetical protein